MRLAKIAELHKEVIHKNPEQAWKEYQDFYKSLHGQLPPEAHYKKIKHLSIFKENEELKNWDLAALNEICADCFLNTTEYAKRKEH